jgi:hypothetical protein
VTWLKNILLSLIALGAISLIGKWLLLISMIICILQALRHLKKEPLSNMFEELSCGIDEVGNVIGGPLFNVIFFKPGSTPVQYFGSRKHTISMVMGVSWEQLNPFAIAIAWIFVKQWDRTHFERAAQSYYKLEKIEL